MPLPMNQPDRPPRLSILKPRTRVRHAAARSPSPGAGGLARPDVRCPHDLSRAAVSDSSEISGRDQQRAHVERAFTDAAAIAAASPPDRGPSTDFTDLRPDSVREVWVFAHDDWWVGALQAWHRRGGHWEGWVAWSEGVGEQYIDWLHQDRIKPLTAAD